MWNVLTVPTVWYVNCTRQCVVFLFFLQCGILTVPLKYHNVGTVKIPHSRNSKNIPYYLGQLKYQTVGTVRTFHIVGDS
jgi:hypothetical protein